MSQSLPAHLLHQQFREALAACYPTPEADHMAFLLLEARCGMRRQDMLLGRPLSFDPQQLQHDLARLLAHEPLQYVLGIGHFYGHDFRVTPDTLIPRPETEELVYLIINRHKTQRPLQLLDIGTGTGCIPITLSLELPGIQAMGLDISPAALQVAQQNAETLKAPVRFLLRDILSETLQDLPPLDVVVSNPPYVTEAEKALMRPNVLDYEPELALFVPDADPLRFYRRIAELAAEQLKAGGWLYFEINEQFGPQMLELVEGLGFQHARVLDDMQGKARMLEAQKPA